MVVDKVLHMNAGNGDTSYANQSSFQAIYLSKTRPVVEETIKDMFKSGTIPSCFNITDLGCSSGPNTFLAVSGIIKTVHELCQQMNRETPEFHVFLNDLPGNDFNSVFKLIPNFHEEADKLGLLIFITGVPGSFYNRLFPSKSLHFVHSTSSVHWLSQVPHGLEDNKGCIYISKKSPPQVLTAYMKQFERDFSVFLSRRAEEIVVGGRMVLELFGRSSADPTCKDCYLHWQLLADSLLDMAAEGLVKEIDVDSFNMPYYTPFVEEAREIIKEEGSFNIEKLEPIELIGDELVDIEDSTKSGQMVAQSMRAVIDDLFLRFGKRMEELTAMVHLGGEKGRFIILTISLAKK